MKKITLLAVAVLAISFASCKKDRTCTCTSTSTPTSGPSYTSTDEITVKKAKKKDALNGQCRSMSWQQTAPTSGTKTEVTCELK
ncbi:MAG: hypothetical protein Q7W45_13250 [Bacteroidota bacterium]|nr:hypothetical protein [Bacteroidota bacterium]MDP3144513.1 hypothetical protein [Bacteroidota bacterium]MDP3555806.1 hypothetical protein [Bacteroidota bacterium]